MEFRLNKIDTDLRERINEETAEGRIHTKKDILIDNSKYDSRREQKHNKRKPREKFSISKYVPGNGKINVDAVKVESVDIKAEKDESLKDSSEYKGLSIDSRR